MKKTVCIAALAALIISAPAFAQKKTSTTPEAAAAKEEKKEAIKEHLENHFKIYGFIRNYFAFDSRESFSGTGDMFYYMPKDNAFNELGEDVNALPQFRFLSLTSRVGVDVSGYEIKGMKIGAKIEADFYAGLDGKTSSGTVDRVSGTASLRLRQAFVTLGWEQEKTAQTLKMGQAWHPMAADMPDVFSLNTGAPFGPFSRTPQVTLDASFGEHFTMTGSLLWQMQYKSAGPEGASAKYMKYSCTPEAYFGLTAKTGGFLARAGVDVLSIKPRSTGKVAMDIDGEMKDVTVKVKDRITTVSPFVYVQYKTTFGDKKIPFAIKAKTIFAEAGEHMNLCGGYGICANDTDGNLYYTPTRNSSTWFSMSIGKTVQGVIFAGYIKNFGTKKPLDGHFGQPEGFYFYGQTEKTFNSAWRLTPTIMYNLGKFTFGVEYEVTSAQYGVLSEGATYAMNLTKGIYDQGLHWVTNHRAQAMVKFTF